MCLKYIIHYVIYCADGDINLKIGLRQSQCFYLVDAVLQFNKV